MTTPNDAQQTLTKFALTSPKKMHFEFAGDGGLVENSGIKRFSYDSDDQTVEIDYYYLGYIGGTFKGSFDGTKIEGTFSEGLPWFSSGTGNFLVDVESQALIGKFFLGKKKHTGGKVWAISLK